MDGHEGMKKDPRSGSKFRRTLIVILLIILIILILLLIRRCTAALDPLYTDSDKVTDNQIGRDPGGIGTVDTDPPSPPVTEPDPPVTTEPDDTTDEPDDPYIPPADTTTDDSEFSEDPYVPPATSKPSDTTKPDTTTKPEDTTEPSKDITLGKFFGFIDVDKDEFVTEDWTPGSKETIGYIISGEYNQDRTLFFTLNIKSDQTPADDHVDNEAKLSDVLTMTIKYYDFKRTEETKDVPPVFTKTGTFTEIAALGAIEIGTLYKDKDGTCELEVVMNTDAGNEYAFAKLDAEFLWSAE